jgi:bacteriorhodopsin
VLLLVAAVTEVLGIHGPYRWVWAAIGVAALFIIVMSLVRRKNLGKVAPHP